MDTYVHIPEAFFHHIWRHKLLKNEIKSIHGDTISVIRPGNYNTDSGPDFLCAKIRIDDTLWVGNVEIHVRASDWYKHRHHKDDAYNSVILHVVAEYDMPVVNRLGREIKTLCLSKAYDRNLLIRYKEITQNLLWVPCEKLIHGVPSIHATSMINASAVQRIHQRAEKIKEELSQLKMDWELCCYRIISRQFGARVNTASFEMLTRSLPVKVLMKHQGDLFRIESLLFGQSGLLNMGVRGRYPRSLKKEHAYLAGKYGLKAMPGYLWKFMRMRPAAFPSLRIAQLAALYTRHQSIFQQILERKDIESMSLMFSLTASEYWDTHFIFDRISKKSKKRFGKQSIQLILLNAIIPLIHLYGQEMNKPELCERALSFLESLPPENNAVIRKWESSGIKAHNGLESQGLLQLKKNMCDHKRCLECSIGHQILKSR